MNEIYKIVNEYILISNDLALATQIALQWFN